MDIRRKQVNFRLPVETIRQLEKLAHKKRISRTALLTLLIDEKYKQERGQNGERTLTDE